MTVSKPASSKKRMCAKPGPAFVAAAALALASTAAPVGAQLLYGSIAFSQKSGGGYAWGFAWNYGSRFKARRDAIGRCRALGGGSCRQVGWFRNACGAIAIGDGGGYGAGWGETFAPAEEMAMSKCRGAGNANCRVETSRCAKPAAPSGLTRAQRRRVQTALAGRGTDPGPADGVFGPRTRAAVRAWQSSRGYAATGELTEAQVRELLGAQQPRTVEKVEPQQARAAEVETETVQAATVRGGDLWGSIAFSQESGGGYAWGIVWNSAGREAAKHRALAVCRGKGGGSCHEAGWFRNQCGALALGDGNGYGVDGGATTGEAERAALAACRKVNRECRVEVSRCSSQGMETAGVEAPPQPSGPVEGQKFRDCAECPEMVVVPSGRFMMGSSEYSFERPVHEVTIGELFAVGVYEVTFDEWDACRRGGGCSHNPSDQGWGRGTRPVINVSWEDAQQYVRWLSNKTGERYRLLSASEWEYVARAGTTTAYHFGGGISPSQANYDRSGHVKTVPVGSYPGNGFGLHDVHGNVWEWVEDCWNDSYRGAPSDGSAWTSGDCSIRVLRGGSWDDYPEVLRSAGRGWSDVGIRRNYIGFRVARTLD